MNLVNLAISIILTVILFIVFRWLIGYAAAEFNVAMPGGVIAALALLFAIVFGWYGYTRGPWVSA